LEPEGLSPFFKNLPLALILSQRSPVSTITTSLFKTPLNTKALILSDNYCFSLRVARLSGRLNRPC